MEQVMHFVWETFVSGVWSAALLTAAGFLFRGQIGHWLNKDLERAKAQHQRELESYKVSLIAESERAKAAQELKKAAALKIVEMQFSCLDRYHRAYLAVRHEIPSAALMPGEFKTIERCSKWNELIRELTDAENSLDMFLTLNEQTQSFEFRSWLHEHYVPFLGVGAAAMPAETEAAVNPTRTLRTVRVENLLRDKIEAMQDVA
jgi:hypothetical protein